MIKIELKGEEIAKVMAFCNKKNTHRPLMHIKASFEDDSIKLAATDGSALAVFSRKKKESETIPQESFSFCIPAVEFLKPAQLKKQIVQIESADGKSFKMQVGPAIYNFQKEDFTFPNYKLVMKTDTWQPLTAYRLFKHEYLKKVSDTIGDATYKRPYTQSNENSTPCQWDYEETSGSKWEIVLMPIKTREVC